MILKDLLTKKEKRGDLFWAIVIEPGWIQAGIWEIRDNKAQIKSISSVAAWETDEELINAADAALSSAVQSIPEEDIEPSKTVFGVPPSWVSGGQIKEEYLDKVKKICSDLSLEPSGFVVLPEAIAHFIKSEEGSPTSAIVVGLGKNDLEIAIFKLGNLAGTTTVARSVSVSDDVVEGLSRLNDGDSLPSRFIIYDGKEAELEEVRQALINTSWEDSEKTKFLHTPKIEILSPEKKVLATSLAGASEIANVSLLETEEEKEEVPQEVPKNDIGFAVGRDVVEVKTQSPGFVQVFRRIATLFLNSAKNFRPKIVLPNFSGLLSGKSPLFGLAFLLIVLIIGFGIWWFYPKADVVIFVSAKSLEEKLEVILDPDPQSPNPDKKALPVVILETKVLGEKTKETTGTKTIGDRSKGTVKIQNGTAASINLPSGTALTAANDLKYSLDKSASVSAALSPTAPGTAVVEVTALDIGAAYNLAKDESFKIGNYPKAEVDAVATVDFSGGSSREISAVDAYDSTSLEKELRDELMEKAKASFSSDLTPEQYLISESMAGTISSKVFSNKIGDEAANLKLTLALDVKVFVVSKKDLGDFSKGLFQDRSPQGYVLRESQVAYSFELKEAGLGNFEVVITANFLPEAKPEEIANQIAGKLPSLAESYLTSIPGFSRAEITIFPRFPGRLGTLPHVAKNITIEVAAER